MRTRKALAQQLGLGSFAGTRRSKQDDQPLSAFSADRRGYRFAANALVLHCSAAANPARARGKAFIVAHNQLRLNLVDRIHGDAHHDQQRGAAEVEVDAQSVQQPAREMRVDKVADKRQMLQLDP